jgi:hypothetical protein
LLSQIATVAILAFHWSADELYGGLEEKAKTGGVLPREGALVRIPSRSCRFTEWGLDSVMGFIGSGY